MTPTYGTEGKTKGPLIQPSRNHVSVTKFLLKRAVTLQRRGRHLFQQGLAPRCVHDPVGVSTGVWRLLSIALTVSFGDAVQPVTRTVTTFPLPSVYVVVDAPKLSEAQTVSEIEETMHKKVPVQRNMVPVTWCDQRTFRST